MIQFYRGVARRLFKSRHNMIEGKILGVKAPGESKVELPCRGNGGRGGRVAEYATERHINFFFKTQNLCLGMCLVEP